MTKPTLKWSKLPEKLRPVRIKPARRPNKKNLKMTYMEKCGHQLKPKGEMIYQVRKELNLDNHVETGMDRGIQD